jgi:mono/diheme cytochrome c family protein
MTPQKLLFVALVAMAPMSVRAADPPGEKPAPVPGAAFVQKYCLSCHGAEKKRGDLDLSGFRDEAAVVATRKVWSKAVRAVRDGEMPPKGAPQPTADEREAFAEAVRGALRRADAGKPRDPGRVTIRRLNRAEYNNTVRDLCQIEFEPADNFPADEPSHGFDNQGDALSLSPLLMERYLDAAEVVVTRALAGKPAKPAERVGFAQFMVSGSKVPYRLYVFTSEPVAATFRIAADGEYLVRVESKPVKKDDPAPEVSVIVDGKELKRVTFAFPEKGAYTRYEIPVALKKGNRRVSLRLLNPPAELEEKKAAYPPQVDANRDNRPGLELHAIDLVGPTDDEPESRRRILACDPKAQPREQAREILTRFADRAFRRPATAEEMDRYLKLYDRSLEAGQNFEAAIGTSLQAILVSPNFLFRVELDDRPQEKGSHPISEYQLASRLSYFLWSSMPDEALLALAAKGELSKNLDAQVTRMLADDRSDALVENFAPQWLDIRDLARVTRGPQLDVRLRESMARETLLFCEEVLRKDRPITDFLDGRYTFLNERLARHYGLAQFGRDKRTAVPVPAHAFVRVELSADGPRAGVLTHASVLTMTSNPDRTSPVKRGTWILENVLASPTPPPPADVPALEQAAAGTVKEPVTVRGRLELHRSKPGCAACHAKIDPLGFALERFDVLGQYRDKDGKAPVDDAAELSNGQKFQGTDGLRKVLLGKKDQFTKCLTEKMLTYALGRGLGDHDGPTVDAIVAAMSKDNYRFQRLVFEVVRSSPFTMRRGTKETPK